MPGSWEVKANNQVLCAILHTEVTTVAWSFGLRNLIIPGQIIPLCGMPYDHARNNAVHQLLGSSFEWLFFLDSDVIPPRDAILRLLAHKQPFISGVYARRSPPVGVPVMLRGHNWITEYPANSIIEVDLVGAGCLLMHRTVFEKLPPQRPGKPWFDWRVDMKGILPEGECMSEDFTLCIHYKRHGGRVLVDTGVVCRHVGFGESRPGSFGPMDTTPNT